MPSQDSAPRRPGDERVELTFPLTNSDPDFYVPAAEEQSNAFVRAWRVLFPRTP